MKISSWKNKCMKNRELLQEIDITLDQLIKNAAALTEISSDPLYETEVQALNKTQGSLLAHLLHLDQHLKERQKDSASTSIHQKLTIFSELSSNLAKSIQESYAKPSVKRCKKCAKTSNS